MFLMVEAFTRTGLLHSVSRNMVAWFGTNLFLVGIVILVGVAALSSVLANIPVVAAMVLLLKGYFVAAELAPEMALGSSFTDWPARTLPVFMAMMFAGTLGGNATLIGASANVVSAGICSAHSKQLSFGVFARYGMPIAVCQLAVAAVYVLAVSRLIGH
jgi:Na+/H+ antiporter NhaD/arsenite permease-like protein